MTGPRINPGPLNRPTFDMEARVQVPEHVHELLHDVAVAVIPIILAWLAKILIPRQ